MAVSRVATTPVDSTVKGVLVLILAGPDLTKDPDRNEMLTLTGEVVGLLERHELSSHFTARLLGLQGPIQSQLRSGRNCHLTVWKAPRRDPLLDLTGSWLLRKTQTGNRFSRGDCKHLQTHTGSLKRRTEFACWHISSYV